MNTDKLMELEQAVAQVRFAVDGLEYRGKSANSTAEDETKEEIYMALDPLVLEVESLLPALRAEQAVGERKPDGYAYRYPDAWGSGRTVIEFNRGQDRNGNPPIEAVPYYFGTPPADQPKTPDEQAVGDEQRAREILAEEFRYAVMAEYLRNPAIRLEAFSADVQAGVRAIRRALGAARQPDALKGWRVVRFSGVRTGDERWEVYDEKGNGGAIYLSDIGAGIVRSLLDRLAAARQSGMVLVPREPTAHMIESATGGCHFRTADCETLGDERALLRRQWAAMLAAAPGGEGLSANDCRGPLGIPMFPNIHQGGEGEG